MRFFTLCFLLLVALLMTGCSTVEQQEVPEKFSNLENLKVFPVEPEPAGEITLTHEATYGDTEEVVLGEFVSGAAVDDRGKVYLNDMRAATIQVYNPDGSYLRSVGGSGRGPGEFQLLKQIRTSGGRLHALDSSQLKISVFDLDDFEHLEDISIAIPSDSASQPSWYSRAQDNGLPYNPDDFAVTTDGSYLITFIPGVIGRSDYKLDIQTRETSKFDADRGEYVKNDLPNFRWTGQILVHSTGNRMSRVMFSVPYKYSSKYHHANGIWVNGWTEDLLFRFYDEEGAYREAWYYPRFKIALTQNMAAAFYENPDLKEAVRADDLPETLPQFRSLMLDDEGRLSVTLLTENKDEMEWWVLDSEGELLGTVTRPSNESFQVVENGHLYTRTYDLETGLQQVHKYRIEI